MSDTVRTSEADRKVPLLGRVLNIGSAMMVAASWFATFFGVKSGFLVSYGGDFFGPMMMYTAIRQDTRWPRVTRSVGALGAALFVFGGCSLFEVAQGLRWMPGVFDPGDFLGYAAGVLVCLNLDRRITPIIRQRRSA